jgi:hypothetical protein
MLAFVLSKRSGSVCKLVKVFAKVSGLATSGQAKVKNLR